MCVSRRSQARIINSSKGRAGVFVALETLVDDDEFDRYFDLRALGGILYFRKTAYKVRLPPLRRRRHRRARTWETIIITVSRAPRKNDVSRHDIP